MTVSLVDVNDTTYASVEKENTLGISAKGTQEVFLDFVEELKKKNLVSFHSNGLELRIRVDFYKQGSHGWEKPTALLKLASINNWKFSYKSHFLDPDPSLCKLPPNQC